MVIHGEYQGSRFAFLSFCTELQHSEQQNFGRLQHGILKVHGATRSIAQEVVASLRSQPPQGVASLGLGVPLAKR